MKNEGPNLSAPFIIIKDIAQLYVIVFILSFAISKIDGHKRITVKSNYQ